MKSNEIAVGRLYDDLAHLVHLVSPPADYAEEAACWRGVLAEKLGAGGRPSLLELGVGGGHNLSHLTHAYEAVGVDLSPAMLELCRRLNPGVELLRGDMRSVRLGRRFDAVLIHDAVSYLLSAQDIAATFATAAAHLRPGGVLIACPDNYAESFNSPQTCQIDHAADGVALTYFEYLHDPDPADNAIEAIMTFFIRDQGGLRVELDRHVMGLFARSVWTEAMAQAGFDVEVRPFALSSLDRPYELLVGVLRQAARAEEKRS